MSPLSIEERLCAAAHHILTDTSVEHAPQAIAWARATLGRDQAPPVDETPLSAAELGRTAPPAPRWAALLDQLSPAERRIARRISLHSHRSTTTPRRGHSHVPA